MRNANPSVRIGAVMALCLAALTATVAAHAFDAEDFEDAQWSEEGGGELLKLELPGDEADVEEVVTWSPEVLEAEALAVSVVDFGGDGGDDGIQYLYLTQCNWSGGGIVCVTRQTTALSCSDIGMSDGSSLVTPLTGTYYYCADHRA